MTLSIWSTALLFIRKTWHFRYKALDRLENERTLLLLQHLGFVHCPKREHCPAFPNCMDCLIENLIATKGPRLVRCSILLWTKSSVASVLFPGRHRPLKVSLVHKRCYLWWWYDNVWLNFCSDYLEFSLSNSRPGSGTWSGKNVTLDPQVNLVLLGNQGLAEDLQNVIRVSLLCIKYEGH